MAFAAQVRSFLQNPSVRSLGIYTFTNFLSKAASFLLLFVFTNPFYITPAENGLLSLFSTSLLFLMPFVSMGVVHSTGADFFKLDKPSFRNFFTSSFILPVLVTLMSVILMYAFREKLQAQFGLPFSFALLVPLVTFGIFCHEQLLNMARSNNEPGVYLRANIGKTILELGVSIVLVIVLMQHWQGRVTGIVVSYALIMLYAFWYFTKKGYLFGKVEKKYILGELQYAIPVIALQASIFAMNASDKFFLSIFTDDQNKTVGVYSIACVFASMVNVLSMALLQFYFPQVYSTLSQPSPNYRLIRRLFYQYAAIMTIGLVLSLIVTPFILRHFINENYHSATGYSHWLLIGVYIWAITYFFYSFLLYHKTKRALLWLSLSCIAVSLASNYYFIRSGNAADAALSVCVVYAVVLLICLLFTRKYWKRIFTGE